MARQEAQSLDLWDAEWIYNYLLWHLLCLWCMDLVLTKW